MTLLEFIKPLDKQALLLFAKRCETTPGQLKQVAYGNRRANAALAISLERETDGAIRCEDTRPDIDWGYLRNSAAPGSVPVTCELPLQRRGERRAEERRQKERRHEDCRA